MSRFMTNSDVIQLFEKRDAIISENPEMATSKEVEDINNKIIEGLGFLVYSNAKQYRKFPNYEDLIQEGFIGLIKATRRFNHKLFPNFFVYAERWIRHSIKRSASRFDVVYSPNRTRVVYAEPTDLSRDEDLFESPEETFCAKETGNKIEQALRDLSARDCDIIKRIFGLGNYSPQTLREIGPVYDLTHERIRQIKNQAMIKLRKNSRLSGLY